jgi:Domain of unknown function (DUF4258)
MSETLQRVRDLVAKGEVRISEHGYDELADDEISVQELISGLLDADLVEDYPDFPKGPCTLVLQSGTDDQPIHALWGIPKGVSGPAVLITAYRPNPDLWENDFLRRRP